MQQVRSLRHTRVVRDDAREVIAHAQRNCEMNRVEGSQRRRLEVRRQVVEGIVEADQRHRRGDLSGAGDGAGIGDAYRSHRLPPDELARYEVPGTAPVRQPVQRPKIENAVSPADDHDAAVLTNELREDAGFAGHQRPVAVGARRARLEVVVGVRLPEPEVAAT